MTTALQRFLNIVFILLSPIPVLAALVFFLNSRDEQAYTPLVGLLACAPLLILAVLNFIVYKKLTLWHKNDEGKIPPKKQMLLALIPAGISLVYALSVMTFYWRDTKPLYLECEITKSEKNQEDAGGIILIGIRHVTHTWSTASNYFSFTPRGWLSKTPIDLGIMWWDFDSESWTDPLSPLEYAPDTYLHGPDGGLIIWKDKFVSRGWRFNEERAAASEKYDTSPIEGRIVDDTRFYEPFDRLTISRETGKYTYEGGMEGVCKTSSAPTTSQKSITRTNTKF